MSDFSCNDHGLLRRKRKIKCADREYKHRLKQARKRISSFLGPAVCDADKRMLAKVFVEEENALILCEERRYMPAISLLQEQQARDAFLAAEALKRLLHQQALLVM